MKHLLRNAVKILCTNSLVDGDYVDGFRLQGRRETKTRDVVVLSRP